MFTLEEPDTCWCEIAPQKSQAIVFREKKRGLSREWAAIFRALSPVTNETAASGGSLTICLEVLLAATIGHGITPAS